MFSNEIRPYKRHADHRNKPCDTVHVTHVSVLDIEPRGFHGSKSRLDLPAFLIGQNGSFGTVETYENLQFRHTIGVFDPASGKIDIFVFMKEEFVLEFLLPGSEIIEQPPCTDSLTGRGLDNPEVLPYAYIFSLVCT